MKIYFSQHVFALLLEVKSDSTQNISGVFDNMRGRQDKESYWIHVMILNIYAESLGRERLNSLA